MRGGRFLLHDVGFLSELRCVYIQCGICYLLYSYRAAAPLALPYLPEVAFAYLLDEGQLLHLNFPVLLPVITVASSSIQPFTHILESLPKLLRLEFVFYKPSLQLLYHFLLSLNFILQLLFSLRLSFLYTKRLSIGIVVGVVVVVVVVVAEGHSPAFSSQGGCECCGGGERGVLGLILSFGSVFG